MQFHEVLAKFTVLLLRLSLQPRQTLKLPAQNKGNTLRGAFGSSFRRLVCVPECRGAAACPLAQSCPYKLIFEPSPPRDSDRLSGNRDIPRPFIFRPPLDLKTTYEAGESFEFELVLLGSAVDYLPYFVLAFREIVSGGFGLNRARCELTQVAGAGLQGTGASEESTDSASLDARSHNSYSLSLATCHPLPVPCNLVYSAADQVFHQPEAMTLGNYVNARMALFPGARNLAPILVAVSFLTPTYLRADGQIVREPEFHHLFKRLRDRLNALSTFYGPSPIDADFKALGNLAEEVRTVKHDVHWIERYRTSSKTHQRHELSGFVGSCTFDFGGIDLPLPSGGGLRVAESRLSSDPIPESLLPWLLAGEICHVGKHAAWGNGWYQTIEAKID